MKFEKKATGLGNFAKKGEDIKDGDIIDILDEGQIVEGSYGPQNVFLIKTAGGEEKNVSINQSSINYLVDAYGEDSAGWVGKKAKAWVNRENVSGKFVLVLYLTHPDATLGEEFKGVNEELQADQVSDEELDGI